MIGLMTQIVLEVSTTAIWWTIKKTINGVYYLVWGDKEGKKHVKKIKELEMEIRKLEEKIEVMENYIGHSNGHSNCNQKNDIT